MSEDPLVPRPAATVMLMRDTRDGIKVFLMRRHRQMEFVGGVMVFPGGGVDDRDRNADIAWHGPDKGWWADRLGVDAELAEALVCAAARETFEECGVLFAGAADDTDLLVDDASVYREQRAALESKELSFGEFLRAEKLMLRADLLRPWANWVTPKEERTRRYDTYFFVGALPEGQRADGENTETDQASWITPSCRGLLGQTKLPVAADVDAAGLAGRPHGHRSAGRRTQDRRRAAEPDHHRRELGVRILRRGALQRGARCVQEFVSIHTIDEHPGIATLLLSRPPTNALTRQVCREIVAAAGELGARDDVAAVIVFGGHEIFCAGDDVAVLQTLSAEEAAGAAQVGREAVDALGAIPKPTVAAITGYALGIGLTLALAADWRVAGDNVKVGATEILAGFPPGGTARLARTIGESKAKDLVFSGRFVDAKEALALGVIDLMVAPDAVYDAAVTWAERFVDYPTQVLAAAKASFDDGR